MVNNLAGSHVLVTGATSGIGGATAASLASLGAYVVLTGRDVQRGESAVASIRAAGGQSHFLAADLHDEASARRLARAAVEVAGGHIDVLVNNAAAQHVGATASHTEEQFDNAFDVNVKVPFFLVAELAPAMATRGKGAIVNVASMVAQFGMVGTALYGSSKAALILLTKAWAAEYGPSGVRVNAVAPGPVWTQGTAHLPLGELTAANPHGRPGEPEDVADAITFLASEEARYIYGAVLPVDGGRLAI